MISFHINNHTLNPSDTFFSTTLLPPEPDLPGEGDHLRPDLLVESTNENDETEATA